MTVILVNLVVQYDARESLKVNWVFLETAKIKKAARHQYSSL
jgi:hypothetical protein